MSSLVIETSRPTVSRGRLAAWQIAWTLPVIVFAVSALLRYEPAGLWQTSCGLLLLLLVMTAAVTDLLWYKIPNWLTYPAFTWALVINGFSSFLPPEYVRTLGTVGLVDSLAGAFIPFFFMLMIFSMTGGGAGDVKLTAALGAFLGLSRVVDVVLLSFIFAGGIALVRAVWLLGVWDLGKLTYHGIGSWFLPVWISPANKEHRDLLRKPMPLGPSFALGVIAVLINIDVQRLVNL